MFKFVSKFFDYNQKYLNTLNKEIEEINSFEPQMKKLLQKDFAAKTAEFKSRLEQQATLDDILPEAFALIREAIRRTIGERAF